MEKDLPLRGYKVIELATVVAAPTAGRLLAEFGAEVIKIEPPSGDPLREIGEMHMSAPLTSVCQNKIVRPEAAGTQKARPLSLFPKRNVQFS